MPDFQAPDFFPSSQSQKQDLNSFLNKLKNFWVYFIIIILAVSIFSGTIVKVDAGERAVVFNIFGGVEKRVLGEGIHLMLPFIQRATIYDIKQASYTFTSEDQKQGQVLGEEIHTLTSDGQKIDIELTVRARPQPEVLWELHKSIGPAYVTKIIYPKAKSTVREILCSYPVEDVYSIKRQEIQNRIQEHLQNDLEKNYFIDIEEVLIRNVRFSKEFQDAIDRKQQAFQEYLKMEYVLAGEKSKRDAKILQAEGEAKAISLRVNALRANPDFVKYRRAQVYGKRAKLIFSNDLE
jgi:regulator of protease activity HflC (stomatin/prohibitin superfamily)